MTARNRSKAACVRIDTFTPVTETVDQVSVECQEELAIQGENRDFAQFGLREYHYHVSAINVLPTNTRTAEVYDEFTWPPAVVVAVVVFVETSVPKAYPRVALASASTLSGSVLRTLRGGEILPKMFSLILPSSLGHPHSQCSIVCGSSLQRGHNGSAEELRRFSVGFQQRSVAEQSFCGYQGTKESLTMGSQALKPKQPLQPPATLQGPFPMHPKDPSFVEPY